MNIKAVEFPIQHVGRVTNNPDINPTKVQGEIIGSSLYGGLTEFLNSNPQHELEFLPAEILEITSFVKKQMALRLQALEQSFYRIEGLTQSLKKSNQSGKIDGLLTKLDWHFNRKKFNQIRSGIKALTEKDISAFLYSLQPSADDFAMKNIDTNFIFNQFYQDTVFTKGVTNEYRV